MNESLGVGDLPPEVFRAIVDHSAVPYSVVDEQGTFVYAGASVAHVFGWQPSEIVGRSVADFLPEDQMQLAVDALAEVQDVNPEAGGLPITLGMRRPDGSTAWVEVGATALRHPDGRRLYALRGRDFDGPKQLDDALHELIAGRPLDDVQRALCQSITSWLHAGAAAVHRGFDGQVFEATVGWLLPEPWDPSVVGPWIDCAREGEPVQRRVDELPEPLATSARADGLAGCWCHPVPGIEGLAPSVLSVWPCEEGGPFLSHRMLLDRMARFVQLSLLRSAEQERLQFLAGHDSLTGVANRASFRARLAGALAAGERDLAVAFCDLDQFKPVNDRHGHEAGDAVLVEAAARLRAALRSGDQIARMGGDEFTILLHNVSHPAAAALLSERLLEAMRRPFAVRGEAVDIGLSVGVVLVDDVDSPTADGILARADAALYEVKRAGGGRAIVAR